MIRTTLHISLLLLFAATPYRLSAQSGPWDRWDEETVSKLHTAAQTSYLGEEEKKVILFMNMARHDGPLFAETFVEAYLQERHMESTRAVRSLNRDLRKVSGLDPLLPEADLTAVALGHALETGESGSVGHQGFNQRFKPLMGNPYTHVGENCSYGYDQAIEIVISLLIDEGVNDAGHRKNILNAQFNSVGVAIRPHARYRVNCVIDFGWQNRSSLNEIPY